MVCQDRRQREANRIHCRETRLRKRGLEKKLIKVRYFNDFDGLLRVWGLEHEPRDAVQDASCYFKLVLIRDSVRSVCQPHRNDEETEHEDYLITNMTSMCDNKNLTNTKRAS